MASPAALRWRLLRRSLLTDPKRDPIDDDAARVSRVPSGSFGLISSRCVESELETGDSVWEYGLSQTLPALRIRQWGGGQLKLSDHFTCRDLGIDNTGVICLWPAEEVLAYYCATHPEKFKDQRIIELGAGYGLAGLALAAWTDAAEVLITDGNPKVVKYIQENIRMNADLFGKTKVRTEVLYWSKDPVSLASEFDFLIAADCTYFKDFHLDLVQTMKSILTNSSEAVLFCPRRGTSLSNFIDIARGIGLDVTVKENYDAKINHLHNKFLQGDNQQWLNYDADHNYPLLISIIVSSQRF